jgi:fluoride ion exporter CrcB/FEX
MEPGTFLLFVEGALLLTVVAVCSGVNRLLRRPAWNSWAIGSGCVLVLASWATFKLSQMGLWEKGTPDQQGQRFGELVLGPTAIALGFALWRAARFHGRQQEWNIDAARIVASPSRAQVARKPEDAG